MRVEHRLWLTLLAAAIVACDDGNPSSASPGAAGKGQAGDTASGGTAGASGAGGAATGGTQAGSNSAAGAAAAGSPGGVFSPNPALTDLQDESALDLGQFSCTGVDGEEPELCRRATDYGGFVYEPNHHQMLLFGGGHSTTMTDSVHALDLGGSLMWADLYAPTPCSEMTTANLDAENGAWLAGAGGPFPRPVSTHTYDMLAVAPAQDQFIVISRNFSGGYCNVVGNDIGGKIAHYDLGAGTWSFSATAEGSSNDLGTNLPGSERDPTSGKIVLFGGGGLALYDPTTREYAAVGDALNDSDGNPADLSGTSYANHLVYFPPDDRFYFFVRGAPVEVYALTLDRDDPSLSTLDHLVTTGPSSPHDEPGYDYDSKNQIIGGAVADSTFYAFNPADQTWTSHPMNGGSPGNQAFHALAYDPVDNVFLLLTDYDSGSKTWAYRLKR